MNFTFDDLLGLDDRQLDNFIRDTQDAWWNANERIKYDFTTSDGVSMEIYESCVAFNKSDPSSLFKFSHQKRVYTDLWTDDGRLYTMHALLAAAFSQHTCHMRYQYMFKKRKGIINFVDDDGFAAFANDKNMDFHIQPHIAKQYGIINNKLEQQQQQQ